MQNAPDMELVLCGLVGIKESWRQQLLVLISELEWTSLYYRLPQSPVELLFIPVPLDTVQSVALHLKPTDQLDTLSHQLVGRDVHLDDLQTPQQSCKQSGPSLTLSLTY